VQVELKEVAEKQLSLKLTMLIVRVTSQCCV